MKEISQIHIASFPYHIAVDAKKELERYLQAIETSLAADEEAMREIESRMAELLSERGVTKDKVIVLRDVEALKEQLGEARDFTDETALQQKASNEPEKKLMRDPQGAMFGGVAQGMAAYFRMDVVWVRMLWVILALISGGIGVVVYCLLWVLTPRAITAADRLVMAGKPVTLEALKQGAGEVEAIREPAPLAAARKTFGVALAIFAFVPVGYVALALYQIFVPLRDGAVASPPLLSFIGLLLLAVSGVLVGVFIGQLARMLLTHTAKKQQVTYLIATTVVGTVLAGAGFGSLLYDAYGNTFADQTMIVQNLAAPEGLGSVRQLKTTASERARVKYVVSDDRRGADVKYYSAAPTNDDAGAKLIVKDGVLDVVFQPEVLGCPETYGVCHAPIELWIYGPELEGIEARVGQVFYESKGEQASLTANIHRSAYIDIAIKALERLYATVQDTGVLQAEQTAAREVQLDLETGSIAGLGSVVSVEVTAPVACPVTPNKVMLSMTNTQDLIVNGQKTAATAAHACLDVNVVSSASGISQ